MTIGIGTAALGRPQYINIKAQETSSLDLNSFKQKGLEVLEHAYQSGIRYFDTAPGYGMAEQLLLDWLKAKDDDTIKVATKWGYTYVANFDPYAEVHEVKEHSLKKLNAQWAVSKAFLPYLKVYQIHSATLDTDVLNNQAVLERLAFLKNECHIEIGITTTGANQVEVIKKALDVSIGGAQLFDAFQVTYNILDQSLAEVTDKLQKQNKRLILKEALANGRLFRNKNYRHYINLYDTLEQLAKKYHVGTDAIVLNFCEQTIPKSIVLSGASQMNHLTANLKALEFNLSYTEIMMLKGFKINTSNYWQERKQLTWN